MGGGDLQDVLASTDFLMQTGYPDKKKLVVMGGSYGGYLTMMAVTKAPELWAAGVPIVPFVNWFTEIQNEDPILQQSDLATMGDPEKNPDFFRERSPFFFVDKIKAPLLLLAGAHDPRCPPEETSRLWRRSRNTAARPNTKSTKTKATASRESRTRLTHISA